MKLTLMMLSFVVLGAWPYLGREGTGWVSVRITRDWVVVLAVRYLNGAAL